MEKRTLDLWWCSTRPGQVRFSQVFDDIIYGCVWEVYFEPPFILKLIGCLFQMELRHFAIVTQSHKNRANQNQTHMNEKKNTCCYSVFYVPHTLSGFFLYVFFFSYGSLNHYQIHWMSLKDHNNNGDQISTIDCSRNLRYFWKNQQLDLLLWTFMVP